MKCTTKKCLGENAEGGLPEALHDLSFAEAVGFKGVEQVVGQLLAEGMQGIW